MQLPSIEIVQGIAAVTEITTEQLLLWSIDFERQKKLIKTLKAENELLRAKLDERVQVDLSQLPALCRKQAG